MRIKLIAAFILLAGCFDFAWGGPGTPPAPGPVEYELRFAAPNTHLLDITVRADGVAGRAAEFAIPDWAPGSYAINDYARNVQNFEAHAADGRALTWRKTDKQTWRVELDGATAVAVRYRMYANTLSNNWAQYNERHVFIGGPAVWMYLVGGKERPVRLNITLPASAQGWRVATGLERAGETSFSAADYDWFADCPIEISNWQEKTFVYAGTTYHFVVHDVMGQKDFSQAFSDTERIVRNLVPIFAPVAGTGEQAAPFREYWFLMHVWPESGGGLEHLDSTQINYSADWDDHAERGPGQDAYMRKLFVISHEFFHAWNVKRLRPRPLGPFDYTREDETPSLWISEGVTSYYGELALVRAGIMTPENYLLAIGGLLTKFEQEPGRTERSIEDTSWDTWFRQGNAGRMQRYGLNLSNTNYSYYDGGQVVGHLLDFAIRQATDNRKSLDDWMRLLYSRYALPKPGFEPADAVRAAGEIAGQDMSDFFRRYISGKEPLPYEQYFAYAGLRVEREREANKGWAGFETAKGDDGRTVVSNVIPRSPAEQAGLDRGDVLVGINGKEATIEGLTAAFAGLHPGDTARVTVVRDKELREFPVLLAPYPYAVIHIVPVEKPTELQKKIYQSWMGQPWPEKK